MELVTLHRKKCIENTNKYYYYISSYYKIIIIVEKYSHAFLYFIFEALEALHVNSLEYACFSHTLCIHKIMSLFY